MSPALRLSAKLLFALLCSTFVAQAQTITLTNGVQKYASLSSTTADMSGKCELWVTNSSTPLTACTINLNSSDAWLFLPGVKPSVVVSTYLGQIRVSGASAVADSNVRIVQYGQSGSVIIPQAPSFKPLQAFSGSHFTGTSAQYSQYVYYTGTGLGTMDMNISSFKLKRGYMAVVAQSTSGSSYSKCYIAQDGDLEIGVLPASMDNKIRFIYVTPWRWVSKKGIAGNIEGPLNVLWKYNWNLDQNSTRDLEYVPIRQTRWWPDLNQNWQTRGANTVLGYNEPDNTAQANIAVGDAIWSWPDLLGTGLRVGSPAVTDGGRSSWLYPFMSQADAAGLRVDFVAIHYYWCFDPSNPSGAASQMYNFLKAVYDQTKRPIWITEWNNGADWTGCGDPTYAQQQACIASMIDMLENTPFVERYAPYNWVEDVRRLEWDDGSLTAAGVTYRDKVSNLSYSQAMPDNGTRSVAQYLFETNTLDSSGFENNALAASAPAFTTGVNGQAVVLDGANNYLQLPANIASSNAFTFAGWVYWNGGANWQRIFDFGNDTSHYLFLTPSASSGKLRFVINNGSGEQTVETASALTAGSWQHVAVTLSGNTARIYVNGTQAASSSSFSISPASFSPAKNYLGKSQFTADPLLNGNLDDIEIADYAFTAAQIAALQTNLPPQFTNSVIDRGTTQPFVLFSSNITGTATDPNPGDALTFSKAGGPAWLAINSDGTINGTPGSGDGGTNYFTVRVTDTAGASASALLTIYVPITYGSGVWTNDADGSWDDSLNWSGGLIPNGGNGSSYTADFSTINITADRIVTLDNPRIIGTLKFGDTSGSQNWTLTSNGDELTLNTGSSTSPSIVVNQNTANVAVTVSGTNGFTKSGAGTLILSGANTLTGTLNVDTAQPSSGNDGVLRLASPTAVSVSQINIRNQNAATSTLQLDASLGSITSSVPIALNGRTATGPAIQNFSGTNTLSGTTTINTGGANYIFQSDAGGLLTLGGITSAASGTRTLTFQGSGSINVAGVIANGSATNSFIKSGSGNLTLSAANTATGTNRISGGTLTLANSAALQTSTLDMNASDSGSLKFTVTNATLGGLMGTRGIGLTNTTGVPMTLSIGANGLNYTYSGALSSSGNLIKTGSGTQTLSGVNTFTGTTRISSGILMLGNTAALLNSTLNLDSADTGIPSFGSLTSATFGNLAGTRNLALTNSSNAGVSLTVGGNGQNSAYAGTLSGSGSLNKNGIGTLKLSGANTYSGNTIVNVGTLKLSRDPVLRLSFDNVSGTGNGSVVTNDGTGSSSMDGTILGTGANVVGGGKFGNALSINGSGGTAKTNIVSVSNRGITTDATGSWTVSFWIKTTTAGAVILYQGDGTWSSSGQTTFLLNANSGTTAGTRAGAVRWAGGFLTGTAALNNNSWHHVTLVDNVGTESIYVDGNLDTVTSTMGLALATGANQLWIGGSPNTDTGAVKINGMIDEVSMFNRALSLTEVRSLTNSVPGTTVGSFGGQLPATTPLYLGGNGTFDLGGNSQSVASLSDYGGNGGTVTNSGAAPVTLTISGSGSTTFSGAIADMASSNALSLVKSGASTLTLAGANSYRGVTALNAGTLLVNGTLSSSSVSVANGATLGGNGSIGGTVTVQSGATLSPGTSIGELLVNNALTLQAGSTNRMEISHTDATNDTLTVTGTLNYGGTLQVVNLAGTLGGGDSFKLFNAPNFSGSFTEMILPALDPGLIWNFTPASGVLSVVATNSTQLSAALSGNTLTLSWPADHLGWHLQVQTNALNVGLGTNWVDVPDTTTTNQVVVPADTGNGTVFYRMVYP